MDGEVEPSGGGGGGGDVTCNSVTPIPDHILGQVITTTDDTNKHESAQESQQNGISEHETPKKEHETPQKEHGTQPDADKVDGNLSSNLSSPRHPPLDGGGGGVEERAISPASFTPRYSKFHEATSRKVLIRNCSMEEVVAKIQEGSALWKVRGVNKCYQRHYKVDIDNMSLVGESKKWWSPGSSNIVGSEGSETAVPLLEISEVRQGWKTDTFNKVSAYMEKLKEKGGAAIEEPSMDECKCFSVIHGQGGHDVLDLVAASEEERDAWVTGLLHLVQSIKALHEDKQYDVWLKKQFEEADKDNNGSLTFEECCGLLKQINIKMDKSHAKKLFNQANTNKNKRDGSQVLEVGEFVTFYHALLKMPELENLYKKFASETGLMSAEQLCVFLEQEQGLTHYDVGQATKLINEFEISDLKNEGYMTFDGFYHMLLSDMFDVFKHDHQSRVHQDMTQPLSHYFIDSSHNTYLTGYQLADASSVEGYISVLKRGCRLLELDLWDGEDGEPVITHHHFTTTITLADVLRDGIKPYAFHASPYPVILSIENHLSIEQQRTMVKLMKDILGDMLATDPVPDDLSAVPSPESLKNKVIVRGKKPKGSEVEDDDEDDDDPDSIDYIDCDDGAVNSKKKPHKPLAPELREVVNVCEGRKFIDFKDAFDTYKCVNTPSIGETKSNKLLAYYPDDFLKFTERHVTKVYPLATRTNSSNFKPYPFWAVGCQIVALNQQTEDKPNFYNDALFRSNANCGYVLKPDILINKLPYSPSEIGDRYTKVVRVTILSGQHLPNSAKKGDIVDPYVQVKVRGHAVDKQKQRTKTVKNNGFNPVWNETLELNIKVPQISLIYFSLRDESSFARDPVLGLYCIPFSSLTKGYSFVHLCDLNGKSLGPSALFVHISVKDS